MASAIPCKAVLVPLAACASVPSAAYTPCCHRLKRDADPQSVYVLCRAFNLKVARIWAYYKIVQRLLKGYKREDDLYSSLITQATTELTQSVSYIRILVVRSLLPARIFPAELGLYHRSLCML